jgi:hypothetical protein
LKRKDDGFSERRDDRVEATNIYGFGNLAPNREKIMSMHTFEGNIDIIRMNDLIGDCA